MRATRLSGQTQVRSDCPLSANSGHSVLFEHVVGAGRAAPAVRLGRGSAFSNLRDLISILNCTQRVKDGGDVDCLLQQRTLDGRKVPKGRSEHSKN